MYNKMGKNSYILTVIEEEYVPLAPKIPEGQLRLFIVMAVIAIIAVLLLSVYIMECQKYRLKIQRLLSDVDEEERKQVKRGWNLTYLKRITRYLEDEAVNRMTGEMR